MGIEICCEDIQCDEIYTFPDNNLLLSSDPYKMKQLKEIYKRVKLEILSLKFFDDFLEFKGTLDKEEHKNRRFEVQAKGLETYKNYSDCTEKNDKNFEIYVALKHLLSVIAVCHMVDGNLKSAMERTDINECVTFLFTENKDRDFRFHIGMSCVQFKTLDPFNEKQVNYEDRS